MSVPESESQHVGDVVITQFFAGDEGLREVEFVADAGGCRSDLRFEVCDVGEAAFLLA